MHELLEVVRSIEFIQAPAGPGRVSLETRGLARHGRTELQMHAVPIDYEPEARNYLIDIAAYTLAKKALRSGETIGVPTHFGSNFARAVAAPSIGGRTEALRLCDRFGGDDETPALILATELFEEAVRQSSEGREQRAIELAKASIAVCPGRPTVEDRGVSFNTENYRPYALLFSLTGEEGYLRAALERSPRLQIQQLGTSLHLLPEQLGHPSVRDTARLLRRHCLGTWDLMSAQAPIPRHAQFYGLPQPYLHASADGLSLELATSAVPVGWVELYYAGAARAALESEETIELVAGACAVIAERPWLLPVLTQEAASLWHATQLERGPAPRELAPLVAAGAFAITSILAEVALLAAFEVPHAERRAWFRLDGRSGADERQRARVAQLTERHVALLARMLQAVRDGAVSN